MKERDEGPLEGIRVVDMTSVVVVRSVHDAG
jgi:hypothetical protein